MTISKATGPVLVMTLKQQGLIRVQNSLYIYNSQKTSLRIYELRVKIFVTRKNLRVDFFIVTLPGKKFPFPIQF